VIFENFVSYEVLQGQRRYAASHLGRLSLLPSMDSKMKIILPAK